MAPSRSTKSWGNEKTQSPEGPAAPRNKPPNGAVQRISRRAPRHQQVDLSFPQTAPRTLCAAAYGLVKWRPPRIGHRAPRRHELVAPEVGQPQCPTCPTSLTARMVFRSAGGTSRPTWPSEAPVRDELHGPNGLQERRVEQTNITRSEGPKEPEGEKEPKGELEELEVISQALEAFVRGRPNGEHRSRPCTYTTFTHTLPAYIKRLHIHRLHTGAGPTASTI